MAEELGGQGQEFMEHHEHAHGHGHGEHAASPTPAHRHRCTVFASIFAVAGMVVGLFSGHAANEAIIAQIEMSDQYTYFQAKGTKSNLAESAKDLLEVLGPGVAIDKAKLEEAIAKQAKDITKYEHQKADILKEAERAKHESQHHFQMHQILSYAAAFFSVAVVFSMIAMSLAAWGSVLFGASVLFGVIGAALTAYPYLLLH